MNYRSAQRPPVGIDDMALYVPRHFLPIADLATARGIDPDKLRLGLGLEAMSLPDIFEDTATLAANAAYELIERNGLRPQEIGRLYLGTESALDGAKPTATYVLAALRSVYKSTHGRECLDQCDVVDLTFACIGAVDALLNTVDWVKSGEGRVGIVVASDVAKYELGSTGEYTQGAGAVAILGRDHPRLLAILPDVGVSSRGVHDFFKPVRQVRRADIMTEVLDMIEAQRPEVLAKADITNGRGLLSLTDGDFSQRGVLDANDEAIGVHTAPPTFDGPCSNEQYQARVRSAYDHYVRLSETPVDQQPLFGWERVVVHLPTPRTAGGCWWSCWCANSCARRSGVISRRAPSSLQHPRKRAERRGKDISGRSASRVYTRVTWNSSWPAPRTRRRWWATCTLARFFSPDEYPGAGCGEGRWPCRQNVWLHGLRLGVEKLGIRGRGPG